MTTLNTVNTTTLASKQLKQVIEQLKQDDSSLLQAYSEYAANNNYDSVYDNDDDSINMMFADSYDALRAAFYGDYNPSHAYFTFNGYGNLQSFEYLDSDNSPIDIEELAQWIVDNELFNEYNIEVTTLDDMGISDSDRSLDLLASVEDNITDDENMLHRLSDYLNINLNDKDKDNFSSFDHFILDSCLSVISDYDYNQLNDIITHLNINYK